MTITKKEFLQRRKSLFQKLDPNSIAIIPAANEAFRNNDVHYPFRQNSDFYYLTGFEEPDAIAVFKRNKEGDTFYLFNRPVDPERARWDGPRAGQEGACKEFGADQSFPIDSFEEMLLGLLDGTKHIYNARGVNQAVDASIANLKSGADNPVDLADVLHESRLIKSKAEIAAMKRAAEVSAGAHIRAMKACRPGLWEYQLEGEIMHEFFQKGCRFPAYSSIVGGGANACTLHYIDNESKLKDGDLVLIDAGAEYEYYASDVTRTFPVNGKFSKDQAALYDVVLSAQEAGIAQIKSGNICSSVQNTIIQEITQGLVDLKILKGDVKTLIEEEAHKEFYMHNAGHWIGLDVHDVGRYKVNDQWREFEPGMVMTVEPGIYINAGNKSVDKKWWNMGIRIEDDIVVTEKGCDVLSKDAPKTRKEIETLMKSK